MTISTPRRDDTEALPGHVLLLEVHEKVAMLVEQREAQRLREDIGRVVQRVDVLDEARCLGQISDRLVGQTVELGGGERDRARET